MTSDPVPEIRCGLRNDGRHEHAGRVSVVAGRARATNVSSPLRPTQPFLAFRARFICCSRLSSETKSKNPFHTSPNQRIAHTTDALKTPPVPHRSRRLTPGTAIIQPRSASVLGHGVPRSSEFHSYATHRDVQSQTQKREGQQFTTHQHVHTYHFIRRLDMDDI